MVTESQGEANTGHNSTARCSADLASTTSPLTHRRRRRFWFAMLVLLAATLGCSAVDLFERPTPTPLPTRPLAPTFTPTPESLQGVIIVTPPFQGTPGVIIVPPGTNPSSLIPLPPTETPTPVPTELAAVATASAIASNTPLATDTETSTPTITPTETPSPTPSMTPTPFIMVESGLVALRSGAGVEFPLVAQLGPNIPIAVTGQNPEGNWYQLCCVNGAEVWVAAAHVKVVNDPRTVRLLVPGTPPSPTAHRDRYADLYANRNALSFPGVA